MNSPNSAPEAPLPPELTEVVLTTEQVQKYGGRCFEAGRAARAPTEAARELPTAVSALRSLTEALLTHADNDYIRRQITAAVHILSAHGCTMPVPWPDADFGVERWSSRAASALTQGELGAYHAVCGSIADEATLRRAVSVMEDVLIDIAGWEDKALAEAVEESRRDLAAMVECAALAGAQAPGEPAERDENGEPTQAQKEAWRNEERISLCLRLCADAEKQGWEHVAVKTVQIMLGLPATPGADQ